nr:uncharacterized protein LOC104099365 [Nicotiana tomentosiformis]
MADLGLSFLIENLMQLLRDNEELIIGIKDAAENLLEDLKEFDVFLKKAAAYNSENKILKELVKKIRSVVNAAEDAIDKFVIESKLHKDKGVSRLLDLTHYKRVRDVASEIKSIREKVKEIRRTEVYALQNEDLSGRGGQERKEIAGSSCRNRFEFWK